MERTKIEVKESKMGRLSRFYNQMKDKISGKGAVREVWSPEPELPEQSKGFNGDSGLNKKRKQKAPTTKANRKRNTIAKHSRTTNRKRSKGKQ